MLRSLRRFTLAALPLVLALAGLARADEIRYVDGRKPPGEVQIVSESYMEIVFKIGGSQQKEQASIVAEVIHSNKSARYIAAESKFRKGDLKQTGRGEKGALEEFAQIITDREKNKGADVQWMVHYALFYVAECQRLLGDNQAAIQAYNDVLGHQADSIFFPQVKIGLGEAKLALNDKAGARQAFQELETEARAKKLGRWTSAASFALAEVMEADGSLKEALERFEKVKAELIAGGDRGSANAIVRAGINANRLRALIDPSKAASAAQELERALQEQWKNLDKEADNEVIAAASNALGDVYMKTGDANRALINYLRVATDEDLKRISGEGAKALWGAAQAFEAAKGDDWKNRSEAMRRELADRFPSSPWAKKKG